MLASSENLASLIASSGVLEKQCVIMILDIKFLGHLHSQQAVTCRDIGLPMC